MNYTLHQLRVFLEVVRQQSITRAARKMHMTQPALSIQLKNFQLQFDIPLTEVVGKKLYVTDFGQSIAELAENVLKEADAIRYKTKEYKGLFTGQLKISAASTGKYVIPYFLSGFLQEHAGVDLILDVTSKTQVVSSLRKNEVDFAVVSVVPKDITIKEELLLENRLYLVGNTEHFDKDRPLIFREAGSATRLAMDRYLGAGKKRKRLELTSNEAIKQAVIAGLGYSIIPLIGIKNELASKELHIIPAKSLPIATAWRLVWLKNKKLSPVAQAYLDYVQSNKDQIIHDSFSWYLNFKK
ncbi:MAG: LysR substrate-binding domain-containing protein [Tunicatimonas sp.]|uniref:LysR substrate-binding domain-containing protein n=1 Tax=Tunicatimonas sp. TaxID=1940096 RepID=UPI003C76391F